MPAHSIEVQCGNCLEPLEESPHLPADRRPPCPHCGSPLRHFNIAVSDSVTLHSKLNLKGRRPGLKRPFVEQVVGDDLHRKTGRWMNLERVIDRLKNWYYERVTDPRTGTIVHESNEPLSDHTGHGSARHKDDEERG